MNTEELKQKISDFEEQQERIDEEIGAAKTDVAMLKKDLSIIKDNILDIKTNLEKASTGRHFKWGIVTSSLIWIIAGVILLIVSIIYLAFKFGWVK